MAATRRPGAGKRAQRIALYARQTKTVMDFLKACCITGEMPSFRELEEELGISRLTIGQIIQDQVDAGVLRREEIGANQRIFTFVATGKTVRTVARSAAPEVQVPEVEETSGARDIFAGFRFEDDPRAARPERRIHPTRPIGTYGITSYEGI